MKPIFAARVFFKMYHRLILAIFTEKVNKQSFRLFLVISCFFVSTQIKAFPCYLTLVKDSCWTDYNVTVVVFDVASNASLVSVNIPKGQSWVRQSFTCQPAQSLKYQATFQPAFWESDIGKVYMGMNYWTLPTAVTNNDTAWEVPLCYPAAFSEVPLPPDATANCRCDFTSIPAIKPGLNEAVSP